MKSHASAWFAVVYLLLPLTQAYGTTVSIALSYCPAPATNTLESGSGASASPAPSPAFFLYVSQVKRGGDEYVSATGELTTDVSQAQPFTISSNGQLTSGASFYSTSGLVSNESFVPTSSASTITETFSIEDNMLAWTNDAFVGGQALFCVSSSAVEAIFNGQLPDGCGQVELSVISIASLTTSTTIPTAGQTASSSGGSSAPTNPTPASLSVASTTPGLSAASSGQSSSTIPQSSSATAVSPYPAPTSTGIPNCYDRSPFDGTVNGGYLILCATDLTGFDLGSAPGNDLTDCIAACNASNAQAAGTCLAVEYDITAAPDSCLLKYNIGMVSRGDNQFAQVAIVVNEPYSPSVVFSSETPESSSTSTTTVLSSSATGSSSGSSISTPTSALTTTAHVSTSTTTAAVVPTTSSNTAVVVSTSAATSSIVRSTTSAPVPFSSSSTVVITSTSAPVTTTSTLGTNPSSSQASSPASSQTVPPSSSTRVITTTTTSSSMIVSTTTSALSCSVTPTASLCPTYNHVIVNQGGSCYDVECTATLQGNVLTANTSTANSLSSCTGFCNLYNLALPYGCVGVNYLNTQGSNNCLLLSSITGLRYTVGVDTGTLIYAGYASYAASGAPTPSSTTSTSSHSTTPYITSSITSIFGSASLSNSITSSISLTTTSTSTTPPTCATSYPPGPTQGSLCPADSQAGLSYSSYGTSENYEIECSTLFTGAALGGVVAFDLPDCIKSCQYDNINSAAACVGVSFNESTRSSPPINNCFPFASITGVGRGNAVYASARLLYAKYPCIIDYSSGYNPTASASSTGP